jgi:Flp pilus assembly protein TadD
MTPALRLLLAAGSLALGACSGVPATPGARALGASFVSLPASDGRSLADAGITSLDAEMREFLAREVSGRDDPTRLRQLLRAVLDGASFRVDYGDDTRSASATFHARRGNCLSFTNLFVALARESGLRVSYQEVDVPPIWTARDESFVVSRHVNAVVAARNGTTQVVDFDMAAFRAAYPRRAISDARAAAHYYSNLGVERLEADDAEGAFAHFAHALALDRTLAQAWINLGAWYRRQGDATRAEASYLEALRIDPRELVAMSNLSTLHARSGNAELAQWYERRAANFRLQNPYYRYERARVAYLAGDFSGAARQLREALRRSGADPAFYSLLGMSYRELGRRDDARAAFSRALELADSPGLQSAMRRKLDLLGGPRARL